MTPRPWRRATGDPRGDRIVESDPGGLDTKERYTTLTPKRETGVGSWGKSGGGWRSLLVGWARPTIRISLHHPDFGWWAMPTLREMRKSKHHKPHMSHGGYFLSLYQPSRPL